MIRWPNSKTQATMRWKDRQVKLNLIFNWGWIDYYTNRILQRRTHLCRTKLLSTFKPISSHHHFIYCFLKYIMLLKTGNLKKWYRKKTIVIILALGKAGKAFTWVTNQVKLLPLFVVNILNEVTYILIEIDHFSKEANKLSYCDILSWLA